MSNIREAQEQLKENLKQKNKAEANNELWEKPGTHEKDLAKLKKATDELTGLQTKSCLKNGLFYVIEK